MKPTTKTFVFDDLPPSIHNELSEQFVDALYQRSYISYAKLVWSTAGYERHIIAETIIFSHVVDVTNTFRITFGRMAVCFEFLFQRLEVITFVAVRGEEMQEEFLVR